MKEWVQHFYTTQNDWLGVYLGDLDESHLATADLVRDMLPSTPASILELGAGGGQTAIALAQEFNASVTMIELLEDSCLHASKISSQHRTPIHILQDNFYTISLAQQFDLVCYFDSFGIGEDYEQKLLLRRIAKWLQPQGHAIIEVGATWFWGGIAHGQQIDHGACMRQYDFDFENSRLIDRWWLHSDTANVIYQSLRCYTPADLNLLLDGTGLAIKAIIPGGKIDFEQESYIPNVELEECMTYFVLLQKTQH